MNSLPTANVPIIPDAAAAFPQLPDTAFVRLPVIKSLNSVSSATVWRWVKSGLFPAPVRLSPGVTAWRVGEVRAFLAKQG